MIPRAVASPGVIRMGQSQGRAERKVWNTPVFSRVAVGECLVPDIKIVLLLGHRCVEVTQNNAHTIGICRPVRVNKTHSATYLSQIKFRFKNGTMTITRFVSSRLNVHKVNTAVTGYQMCRWPILLFHAPPGDINCFLASKESFEISLFFSVLEKNRSNDPWCFQVIHRMPSERKGPHPSRPVVRCNICGLCVKSILSSNRKRVEPGKAPCCYSPLGTSGGSDDPEKIGTCIRMKQANPRDMGRTCKQVVALIGSILEQVMSVCFADLGLLHQYGWIGLHHRMGADIHQKNLAWSNMSNHAK